MSSAVLGSHPHLAHYIFALLNNATFPPPRSALAHQHPLSVSSSTGSEAEDSDDDEQQGHVSQTESEASRTSTSTSSQEDGVRRPSQAEKEDLVKRVVELLDSDQEEQVRASLKPYMGELGTDDILMDQVCLDCMHKRRDDRENIPYAPHLTPTRTRPAPGLGSLPGRPFTPSRVPSFRARTPLSRAHSPAPPVATLAGPGSTKGYSPAPSPMASPRVLSAKANTFAPSSRVVSAPTPVMMNISAPGFIPSDAWRDAEPPRSGSPFGSIGTPMSRTASNLASATPLFSDQSSPFHSPAGTPQLRPQKLGDYFSVPSPSITGSPARKGVVPDDDDDDEFSPFGKALPPLHHHTEPKSYSFFPSSGTLNPHAGDYHSSSLSSTSTSSYPDDPSSQGYDPDDSTGMTPLDVLCSVFTTIPRPELEDALHKSGYDFEAAMSLLVSTYTLPRSGASTPQRVSSPHPLGMGRGGRDGYLPHIASRTLRRDSPGPYGPAGGTQSPGGHGAKMCRYFLAGECRRSDCRFSHDLDRAMCRFWLRGGCVKGPSCEFLHQFPNNLDVSALENAMSRVELSQSDYNRPSSPGVWPHQGGQGQEDFPDLMASRTTRAPRFDPSRNRFANAVKRAAPALPRDFPSAPLPPSATTSADYLSDASSAPAPVVPRPSARIPLRPPTLLPTLSTGSSVNDQYLSSRSSSLRLGHARNACLARAADAFRRGDGAAAKRFSREGKALNMRMINEASEAAQHLVRERQALATTAVRDRPSSWSDDPSDRSERGKPCAGGLGVVLGVAARGQAKSAAKGKGGELDSGERTEVLLDLHTLHGNEGVEITGQFLAELERERFRGIAYIVIGQEKHVGNQDPLRGAGKVRLGASVKSALAGWGYAWNEGGGVIWVDVCRNSCE